MKKLLYLMLVLSIGLSACGDTKNVEERENVEPPELEVEDQAMNKADDSSEEVISSDESEDLSQQKSNYEIVRTESDNNFPTLFIIISDKTPENLKLIAKELKSEYPSNSVRGFKVLFFTEDYQEEVTNNDTDNAFAKLIVNYKGNVSKLILFENNEQIIVE